MKTDWITKGLLLFLGSGLWAVALMHGSRTVSAQEPSVPDVIKAHKFLLVDDKGAAKAEMKINKYGLATLTLCDAQNKPRVELMMLKEGNPGLFLSDDQGWPRASMLLFRDGSPGLILYDTHGTVRGGFATDKNGEPTLTLNDPNGDALFKKP
jgi:hypothetical protein